MASRYRLRAYAVSPPYTDMSDTPIRPASPSSAGVFDVSGAVPTKKKARTTASPSQQRYAKRQAMISKRQACGLCAGKGKYIAAYPQRLIDPCPRCKGTGRAP